MTREQEILARAFNFADDELIAAAHKPNKRWRRVLPAMIAACLAISFMAAYPTLRNTIQVSVEADNSNSSVMPGETASTEEGGFFDRFTSIKPEMSPPELGHSATLDGTNFTMTGLTETTATFTVVKTDNEPIYAAFFQQYGGVLGTTEPNFRDNGTIIRPYTVKLTVDGADDVCYEFPSAAGTYEVVIDFSSLRKSDYLMSETVTFYKYSAGTDKGLCLTFMLRDSSPETDTTETAETEN